METLTREEELDLHCVDCMWKNAAFYFILGFVCGAVAVGALVGLAIVTGVV